MHFDTSISLATSVQLRAGGGTDEAERRTRSASPRFGVTFLVGAGGSSNSKAMASLPVEIGSRAVAESVGDQRRKVALLGIGPSVEGYAIGPGNRLDVDQERLEFRRLGIGVADKGRQRIRPEALPWPRP